jgi:thioesterase domain-containing protein
LLKANNHRPKDDDPRYDEIARRERARRFDIMDSQRKLLQHYVPQYCDIPLVLIRTYTSKPGDERDKGWSQAARVVDILDVGGNHLTLFKGQHEGQFAEALGNALSQLREELQNQTGKDER